MILFNLAVAYSIKYNCANFVFVMSVIKKRYKVSNCKIFFNYVKEIPNYYYYFTELFVNDKPNEMAK